MRSFPIDMARVGRLQVISVTAKSDGSGGQKSDRDGVSQWTIQCLQTPPKDGDFQPKPVLTEVTVAHSTEPKLPGLQDVTFENLVARAWEMNGRSGVALGAVAVQAVRPAPTEG